MEAFRPGLCAGSALLCDLDTVFAGDASALAKPSLAAMEDYFYKGRVSSALMLWQGNVLVFLYKALATDPEPGCDRDRAARSRTRCTATRLS